MAIKVFADAGSNLFGNLLREKNADIHVFSMTLDVNGEIYHCYDDDIDAEKFSSSFYQKMRDGADIKTALVNPAQMYEAFKKEAEQGNDIIVVTMSNNISGTNQSAVIAASMVADECGRDCVRVINSKTCGFGEGMVALKADALAKEGKSLDEAVTILNDYVEHVCSEFTVDDLKYLYHTGRVSKLIASITGMLNIKALLKGDKDGKISLLGKAHGRKMSLKNLVKSIDKNIVDRDSLVYITHCDCLDDANELADMLHEKGIKNTEIYFYDLISGAHVGPGALAIFYIGQKR